MDDHLRQLRRLAAAGDPQAALRYHNSTAKYEQPTKVKVPSADIISVRTTKVRGSFFIQAQTAKELYITNVSEVNDYGGSSQVPIRVNNVPMLLVAHYYLSN